MHIIAVDDERQAGCELVCALEEVFTGDKIHAFGRAKDCLDYVVGIKKRGIHIAYAFLDIHLADANGITLAKRIKGLMPETKIIFVTAHNNYAYEAFSVPASGYLLKPVSVEEIQKTVKRLEAETGKREELGYPWAPTYRVEDETSKKLCVVTFGKFCASVGEKELLFKRSKSKELLALLIDKKGIGLDNAEIEAILWEDAIGDKRKSSYVQKVISSMIATLKEAGVEDVIERHYNYLAIRPEKIECDLYAFLQGDVRAIQSYLGIYMEDYSWAETTTGLLTNRLMDLQ